MAIQGNGMRYVVWLVVILQSLSFVISRCHNMDEMNFIHRDLQVKVNIAWDFHLYREQGCHMNFRVHCITHVIL